MTHPVLDLAAFLQTQWMAALAAIRAAHEARLVLKNALTARCAEHGAYLLNDWDSRVSLKSLYDDLAGELEREMTRELERIGFPASISLSDFDGFGRAPQYHDAPERNVDEFFLRELKHAESRSLLTLGEQLVAKFNPEHARLAALGEAAYRVYEHFAGPSWKNRQVQIGERRGRKVLSRAIYCDSYSPWQLNYAGRNEMRAVLDGIRLLLVDVERGHAVTGGDTLAMQRLVRDGHFSSRMSVDVGPGLTLVFFKDKVEFHFAADVLDLLQASIATYRLLAQEAA